MIKQIGVYIIPFNTKHQKDLSYVDMTPQKLRERLKKYLWDIKFNKPRIALYRLHEKKLIEINFDKAKIIIPISNCCFSMTHKSTKILIKNNIICNDLISYKVPAI